MSSEAQFVGDVRRKLMLLYIDLHGQPRVQPGDTEFMRDVHACVALFHESMHGAGMDADADDEARSPPKTMLKVNRDPPARNWHLSRQQHCIDAVLNFLPADANVVLSPFSLISCMAMLCRGATTGPARDQLAHYCWPCVTNTQACLDAAALPALSTFISQLADMEVCRWANIIMTDHSDEVYKHDILTHFKAVPYRRDQFAIVNTEVQKITTITKKVLSRKPDGTVLINAVYFADQWRYKFDKELMTGIPFTQPTGSTVNVDMMRQRNHLSMAQFESVTAVHLPYETKGLGAWFVKHDTDHTHVAAYTALQKFMQREFVNQTLPKSSQHVDLTVPKFTMNSTINLRTLFIQTTGHQITHVFEPTGHLSRMSTDENEYVSRFDQECILKVDQEGTEAEAVTTSGTTRGGGGQRYNYISFKHTFYMVIHHNDTILFVAKVASPTHPPPAPEEVPLEGVAVKVKVSVNTVNMTRTLTVGVTQHVGEEPSDGASVTGYHVTEDGNGIPIHTYTVQPKTETNKQLIRVVIAFETQASDPEDTTISVQAVYITEDAGQEPEDLKRLKGNERYELPFPLDKVAGERADGWDLRDAQGNTFLKLRFVV
jgi:serine protease inhibitor